MTKSKDVYNSNKLVHHKEALEDIAEGTAVSPVNLQVDLTNACNNRCVWCFYDIHPLEDFSRKDALSKDTVFNMLDSFKSIGGKSVEWTGGGEPTVAPYFVDVVDKARDLGLGQALVTNGKKLDGDISEAVRDFDWVRVSLNSASRDMYKSQHRTDAFRKVALNLINFANTKDKDCVLGVSMITDEHNYKEMSEMSKLAKEAGADNVRISLAYTPQKEKIFEGIWEKVVDQIDESKKCDDGNFRVFAFSNRIHDLAGSTGGGRCYYHHLTAVVGANGGVYPCCYFKYLPEHNLGNINEESFRSIWYGDKRKEFINTIGEDCKASCWMTGKNKLADYIATDKKDVAHINYP